MFSLLRDIRTHGLREALLGGTTLRQAGRLEGFLLRLLFAIVVARSFDFYPVYTSLPKPVGMAAWPQLWEWLGWDLTRLADETFRNQCLLWVKAALVFYVLGTGLPVALPVITFLHIAIRTLNNSQGAAHHGFQMVSLVLLTQTLLVWLQTLVRLGYRLRKAGENPAASRRPPAWAASGNWSAFWFYSIAAAAATYVVSVCSKWDESRGQWLKNSPYVATQIVKTHRQNYYNNLDPGFIQGLPPVVPPDADPATTRYRHPIPPAADWLSRHPALARILFGSGFFLELFAFLAVLDRRAALALGMALITLHGSIEWLMELSFPFNERTVGVFMVNAAGWILLMWRDPAWRPGRKLWMGSALASAALLGAHLATAGSESLGAHFLDLVQHPASIVPNLFDWPPMVKWTWVLATQTVLVAALLLSARPLAALRLPAAVRGRRRSVTAPAD